MDPISLKFIQDNVPDLKKTPEEIEVVFNKNEQDLLKTVSELIGIPEKQEQPKTDWEKRREICDMFDTEMQKAIKNT
jgi:hypothetical protein